MAENKRNMLNEHFFRPKWYSVFINPYFISRRSLYGNFRMIIATIGTGKSVLDVGCGIKPYKDLFIGNNYVGMDIKGGGHADFAKNADYYYDGKNFPFENEKFDVIFCTQVLEHSDEPGMIITESYRVLKTGGIIICSAPFVYPEHEVPFDYLRFTKYGLEKMFLMCGFKIDQITQTTGIFGVFGQLFSAYIFELFKAKNILVKIIKLFIVVFILSPIQILSLFLDKIFRCRNVTLDYIVVAKK
ncbi:MAG: methyltransferase domain-containing protein [Candidatus Magasanikbacteria bacterium]|nr:methyltransferase domain-containing protein [Candidatus Magasanikbacteria bacterium]